VVTFAGEFLSRGRGFAVNGSTLSAAFPIRVRPNFGAAASIRSSHIPSVCLWGWHFIFPTLPEQVGSECRYDAPPDSGLQVCDPQAEYLPRDPAASVLYGVVSEQLETFLDRQRRRERLVPRFVERELRSFLECGVLAHGFLRVHCDACGRDRVVAFSCKGRSLCSVAAGWLTLRPTSSIACSPKFLSGGGCCHSPAPCATAWPMTPGWQGTSLPYLCGQVFASLRRRVRDRSANRHAHCGAVRFVCVSVTH